jgi:signal transduction histidine kinase
VFFLGQLLRSRSLRLAVGLAVVVAIPVGALVFVQYRSLQDLEDTSIVVLETLSEQVADSLLQGLRTDLERPSFEIERIDHLALERRDTEKLLPVLRERGRSMPMVDAFYLWSSVDRRPETVMELENSTATVTETTFAPAGEENARLLGHARELASNRVLWGTTKERIDGRPQVVVFHLLFDSSARDHLSSFLAFRVDLDRLRRGGLASFLTPMMTALDNKTNLATLVADVVDENGNPVFRSDARAPREVLQERHFSLMFFSPQFSRTPDPCTNCLPEWTLRVGYGEGTAAAIAYANTTGHRTLLAVLIAVIVLGIVLASRVALKEMQLAEAKSQFVASVSHDLKTPLALIQLFAETLELGRVKSADRAKEYYGIINREARKLGALINNVLDFARIESGLRMYQLRSIDLGAVVRHVVTGFEPHFSRDGFDVQLRLADALSPVLADEEAVGLAVGNLLSNAMKYSGNSRRIDVTVEPVARGTAVRVADRGVGIHWRHQRRIFRKFYRIEGQSADAPRGCGLGLAIVDQVMRAHHGQVLVESEPGKGSTFTLIFSSAPETRRDEADSRSRGRAPDAAGAA